MPRSGPSVSKANTDFLEAQILRVELFEYNALDEAFDEETGIRLCCIRLCCIRRLRGTDTRTKQIKASILATRRRFKDEPSKIRFSGRCELIEILRPC
jgi:hypothetical protein